MDPGATAAGSSSRIDRNSIERNRRARLRDLFSHLYSLLPPQPTKMSTHQVLEQATMYVNQLQNRVEELKQIKLKVEEECKEMTSGRSLISPVLTITDLGSTLEVNIIIGWKGKFHLCDIIKILMEEGAEVITAAVNPSAGNRIIFSIHCQPIISRIGIATARVQERLENLVS